MNSSPKLRIASAIGIGAIALACGDGPVDPPVANGVALVIAPGALLLPASGSAHQLRAFAVDGDGDSTLVSAEFTSSDPSIVTIAGDIATGGAALGSAQIVATSGDLTSAPILVLRAMPVAGALLVADSQVIAVAPADPAAAYTVGWEYRVRLRGASPSVGQLVIGTGGAPVGGRVASVVPAGGDVEAVLQLVPLRDLFEAISVDERLALRGAVEPSVDALREGMSTSKSSHGGLRFEMRPGTRFSASGARTSAGPSRIEQEFTLGPLTCKAEAPAPLTIPISLESFSGELHDTLGLDLVVEDGTVRRFVVTGSIAPILTVKPRITAALEAKGKCEYKVKDIPIPVGGVLSLFVGGKVPVGVGFDFGVKASFGQLGADASLRTTMQADIGFDCTGACTFVGDVDVGSPEVQVTPVLPNLATSTRFELAAGAFGWAQVALGVLLWDDDATNFKLLEAKGGLEQKFELATTDVQAADPAYASSYALKPVVEIKAASELTPIANLLQVALTAFAYAPDLPAIARSPQGSFSITPSSVAPGDDTQLGDLATFTVTLTDATYLGAYSVEAVQILWRRQVGETAVLEPGRPGCTDLSAAQDQLTFSCQTDFRTEDAGEQTFHAFVRSRILGVPVPVPLEIAADARATVNVGDAGLLAWTFDTGNDGWEEGVTGDGTVFHLEREGGVLKLHGTDDAVGTPNAWIFHTVALPATAQTVSLRVSAHDRDGASVAWRLRLVDGGGTSHTLHGWEVLSGSEGVHLWVDRTASVSAWAGSSVTLYVEQDDNGQHEHEHFYVSEVRIE